MNELLLWGFVLMVFASFGGLGYYTIYRLTKNTYAAANDTVYAASKTMTISTDIYATISLWEKRFLELEHELRARKYEAQVLITWLEKETDARELFKQEILTTQKLNERETKLIELGKQISMITNIKKNETK